MHPKKYRLTIVIYLISAMLIFVACTSIAEDRILLGYVSTFAPPVDLTSKNVKHLNVGHYKQTTSYTCGPAAIMNIMYYYKKLSAKDMNRQTEMRISKEMGATKDGTTQSDVAAWLNAHGFIVYSGQVINSSMLIKNIDKGDPVILAYGNHWMVAVGYENKDAVMNSYIIFSDSGSGHTRVDRETIDSMWAVSKMLYRRKGDVGYYILAVPRRR